MAGLWLIVTAGMLTLLVAAIGKKNRQQCSDYKIAIHSQGDEYFVTENDVVKILAAVTHGPLKGQLMTAINLQSLEEVLEKNVWIRDAQLYFDGRNVLHVSIDQRVPVARIFTVSGNSFYIDSSAARMPLSDRLSARVPVFTGFPDSKKLTARDSVLLNNVKTISQYVLSHPFWMAQVDQFAISGDQNVEMIPVVGNHLVRLGDGNDIAKKLHKLYVFYKEIVAKAGFDKYSMINVGFDGQIVATRKGTKANRADTAQVKLNIEKLIRQSQEVPVDTLVTTTTTFPHNSTVKDNEQTDSIPETEQANSSHTGNPTPLKSTQVVQSAKKPITNPKPVQQKRIPKAIMPKRVKN
jgi:cell division protein FtsQ